MDRMQDMHPTVHEVAIKWLSRWGAQHASEAAPLAQAHAALCRGERTASDVCPATSWELCPLHLQCPARRNLSAP